MSTAIICKYFGATNHRGSRIRVSAHGHKARFVPFSYASRLNNGVDVEDVTAYARQCFPYAAIRGMYGPFTIDEDTCCFTIQRGEG
jgi:hypothetical protein